VAIASAVPDIRAVTITELQGLMLAHRNRSSETYARIPLHRAWVWYTIHAGDATEPIIAIQRDPQPRLEIITEMALEGTNGTLRLRVNPG
jgi:hypothetical protein